jgi:hypothetical protein
MGQDQRGGGADAESPDARSASQPRPVGNTKYSFIVWNWTQNKAQILSKGPGVLKQLQAIHLDEDFDSLNKVDIKLSATGEGLETRYGVQVLPKARGMTSDMAKEAQGIKLEESIEGGIRLSQINNGAELPDPEGGESSGYQKAKATAAALKGEDVVTDFDPEQPVTIEDMGEEVTDEIDISSIPFN